jgi:hypothetical protein
MTKEIDDQNTETTTETQPEAPNLRRNRPKVAESTPELVFHKSPPRTYDTKLIEDFLDVVFQGGLTDSDSVLTWAVKPGQSPAYPMGDLELIASLSRTKAARALYFGTSTCEPDDEGSLRNRKQLFSALHVVVLDDIGTKVPLDKIPDTFPPTYKLESSAGNFQYGYVLTEPVKDLKAAEALIQLVYESGFSDEGGKMPTKLVRLPEGVNGKKGEKRDFVSNLHSMDGPTYTPQELMDAMELGVKWADVLADAEEVTKRRAGKSIGSSPWSPLKAVAPALNGIIDPVLEWLYDEDQVSHDNGQWLDVLCPWSDQHTDGGNTAGYLPVGRGERPEARAFHCFHGHCKGNKTPQYLAYVAANGGPEAGVTDNASDLTARWIYDNAADGCWEIRDVAYPYFLPISHFKNTYPHSIEVQSHDGSPKRIKEHALWLMSKSRVTVYGQTFAPYTTSRIVELNGKPYLNTYAPPVWGSGEIDAVHVNKFTSFLDYLIPEKAEREYFLDWLAAKCQDMGFRGPAMLMVAKKQGVGRSTLTDMITTLLGSQNTENVEFNKIIADGDFNEWVEKPLIISDETLNAGTSDFYHSYEKLKGLIDPRPKKVTINPKYGKKRESFVHSSFIFLSNHGNAIVLPDTDRRFYVLSNATCPQTPKYFGELNKWIDEIGADDKPAWASHVWRWLVEREVDIEALLAPPATTTAKEEMVRESRSALEASIDCVLELWPNDYLTVKDVKDSLELVGSLIGYHEMKNPSRIISRIVKEKTIAFPQKTVVRCEGYLNTIRPRLITERSLRDGVIIPDSRETSVEDKVILRETIVRPNLSEFSEELKEAIALLDI